MNDIVMQMQDWPGTPGPSRLAAAHGLIQQDALKKDPNQPPSWEQPGTLDQTQQDTRRLLDFLEIHEFSQWAREQLTKLARNKKIESGMDIARIAFQGTSDTFIGMVIDRTHPEHPHDQEGCLVTCLYRHPQWLGLNPQLAECRGLEIHIFHQQDTPDEPEIIIATSPNAMGKDPSVTTYDQTGELSQVIREVTTWHGAIRHSWHASSPE